MKNKNLKILAILIPVFMIGIIVYLFFSFREKKEKIKWLENIPEFNFTTIDGRLLTSKDLIREKTKVIVYFSPDCHFCQAEATELYNAHQKYANVQWIWVTSEPLDEIRQFAKQFHLEKEDNIHWCYDEKAAFYRKLEMKSVPYFLAYDKNNRLVMRNSGAIKLEKLLEGIDEKN